MAPRLRTSRLPSSVSPCSSSVPQCISVPACTSRAFSQTTSRQVTARRRKFYEWLNGPGRQLKDPLPGSTNYLGAYDRYGNLIRARPGYQRPSRDQAAKAQEEGAEKESEEKEKIPGGQDNVDELDMAARRDADSKDPDKLPPETEEDLRPFPLNRYFRSQPVLSEELREAIYQRVTRDGTTVSLASVEFGVSNERVGAVVRLKQMEKEWIAQGKKLALPYAKAVLDMLPTTPYVDPSLPENRGKRPIPHEPINDLIVHPATRQQLFVPVAESRQFTRVDAGKAFDNNLLPADERIPHPELVLAERELAAGLSFEERRRLAEERLAKEQAKKKAEEERKQAELAKLKTVPKRRWDFVFQDISVEHAGKDGRGPKGVGWRYGFPHEDRKKGQVKIPTKVEA
ncbi:uncharacterized protein EI97DRAFT_464813 [Westerdykella ornata]|uniref:Eukaryotic mitochondrial regulator protein-domain-containing protein n=1 Tax=Westerdykella ornata TaxID=318751 RepID=A0A6A6JSL3_WESOR|nr:uncharacterized protein EI97DRAFT_464813 [Westerdykella ornata]KAF2279590.1 hypothetical protein EI97DRAFT_464813 [Westerdykella ornata]